MRTRSTLRTVAIRLGPPLLMLAAVLAGWHLISLTVPPYQLPGPSRVVDKFFALTVTGGELWEALWISLAALGAGAALALGVGVPLGIAAGANVTLERAVEPYVNALFVAPVSALTPLFVYWFGLGLPPRIATVFIFCAPVIMLTCYRGARETPRTLAEVARVYGANDRQVFRSVVVPHSVPYIATAARLGLGRAIKGTVLAELVISVTGLGALLDNFSHVFDTASIIATLIFLLLLGVLIQVVAARVEIAVAPWRGSRA
jgi:ABC-type nitrate/sulfonate/bicarbonate transport system permease component